MNTITSVRPYVDLKNNPQIPTTQPQAPAFKGVIGKRVVEEIVYNKPLTIASILAMVGGVIGLSKDKVSDVLESLVDRIKGLQTENASLVNEKANLEKQKTDAQKETEKVRQEGVSILNRANSTIEARDVEISGLKARIRELEKYAVMANVKSIEEIDTVMPDQFLATLQEIEGHNEAAHASLFEYVMTGKGQEEFLAQMERNNILLKGRKDGIDKIPEVEIALNKTRKSVGLANIGYDSYFSACLMLRNVLRVQPKASYIQSPAIYLQVKANAKALIEPMMDKQYHYSVTVEQEMADASDFQKAISKAMTTATSEKNLEYVSETIVDNSTSKSYRTFKNREGNFVDYSLDSLYCGYWGESRIRTPEGTIIRDNSRIDK